MSIVSVSPLYRGRRHSVAVPLIPPPDGETFDGGYRIERNPITGGARLIPPPPGTIKKTSNFQMPLQGYLSDVGGGYTIALSKSFIPEQMLFFSIQLQDKIVRHQHSLKNMFQYWIKAFIVIDYECLKSDSVYLIIRNRVWRSCTVEY